LSYSPIISHIKPHKYLKNKGKSGNVYNASNVTYQPNQSGEFLLDECWSPATHTHPIESSWSTLASVICQALIKPYFLVGLWVALLLQRLERVSEDNIMWRSFEVTIANEVKTLTC